MYISKPSQAIGLFLVAGLVGCVPDSATMDHGAALAGNPAATPTTPSPAPLPAAKKKLKVVYMVNGTSGAADTANIQYSGGYLQNQPLPWSDSEIIEEGKTVLTLEANRHSEENAQFITEIYIEGKLIAQDQGAWAEASVTCDEKGCESR